MKKNKWKEERRIGEINEHKSAQTQQREKQSINLNADHEILGDSPCQNSLRIIGVYFSAVQTKQVKSQAAILNWKEMCLRACISTWENM